MYTTIGPAIQNAKTFEELRDVLFHTLGNCSLPLSTRAPVGIESATPGAPPIYIWPPGESPNPSGVAKMIYVDNGSSIYNETERRVEGGFSAYVPGFSWFQWLAADFLIAFGYEWQDLDVVTDIAVDDVTCEIEVTKETIKTLKKLDASAIIALASGASTAFVNDAGNENYNRAYGRENAP